jgi:hypothetical protein
MKVTWLGAGALAAALLGVPSPSQAGVRLGVGILVGHPQGWRHVDTYRVGYDRGFQEGLEHGLVDAKRGASFNFWHDNSYRCGDAGYYHALGSRGEYVAGYRGGYEVGYRKAYASFGRHYDRHDDGRYDRRYDKRYRGGDQDYDDDDGDEGR